MAGLVEIGKENNELQENYFFFFFFLPALPSFQNILPVLKVTFLGKRKGPPLFRAVSGKLREIVYSVTPATLKFLWQTQAEAEVKNIGLEWKGMSGCSRSIRK